MCERRKEVKRETKCLKKRRETELVKWREEWWKKRRRSGLTIKPEREKMEGVSFSVESESEEEEMEKKIYRRDDGGKKKEEREMEEWNEYDETFAAPF